MTRQEAIVQLGNLRSHCSDFLDSKELNSVWHQDVKALDIAIASIREQEERSNPTPLTSDELRQMVGEWVWVDVKYNDFQCDGWAYIATPTYIAYLDQTLPIDFYGNKFVAYRHKKGGTNE